jgi:hypothetical protein
VTPPPGWEAERDRLLALWELADSHEGIFAQLFARDAYRALVAWFAMRP